MFVHGAACMVLLSWHAAGETGGTVACWPAGLHYCNTPSLAPTLPTGYTRRRPEELAVLTRWFPVGSVTPTEAAWLDVILYSREQLEKEYKAMPSKKGAGEQVC